MHTFHPFPNLPPEIRHAIFLLATPPRVVHVREVLECWDDFLERFQNTSIHGLSIHPDIAYFVRRQTRFADQIHPSRLTADGTRFRGLRQPTLHAYGFTSNQPTAATRWELEYKLPFEWIMDNMDLAFQVFRTSTLRSAAPIPPLLHTCAESRAVLVQSGYQLAFSTRTNGPQTWFHFGRDVLLIESEYGSWMRRRRCGWWKYEEREQFNFLLSGRNWHVGQFRPSDLEKVRRLALTKAIDTKETSNMLRLLPRVKELFLVEWDPRECEEALSKTAINLHMLDRAFELPGRLDEKRELWRFIPVEEADAFWTTHEVHIFGRNDDVEDVGRHAHWLRAHKARHDGSSVWLEWVETHSRIRDLRDQVLSEDPSAVAWDIPVIRYVHLCRPLEARTIAAHRRAFLEEFNKLKERERRAKPSASAFTAQWCQEDDSCFSQHHREKMRWWVQQTSLHTRYPGLLYIGP